MTELTNKVWVLESGDDSAMGAWNLVFLLNPFELIRGDGR
jgi:hypothetical protein